MTSSRRRWVVPMLLQAPADPIRTRPLPFDSRTSPARFTLRVMAGAPRFTIPSVLLTIVHEIGEALVPVLMGLAIERAVSTGDPGQLVLWLGVLAVDFAVLSFSWRFGSRIGELGMLAVQHRLRSTVTEHLLGDRPGRQAAGAAGGGGGGRAGGHAGGGAASGVRRDRPADQPGVALSLATSDVNRLSYAVEIAIYPVGEFAAAVFGGAVLLWISWPLGLAVLLGAPLILWLTDRAGRALRRRSGDEQEAAAAAAGEASDLMAGYRVVRGIGAEAEASVRYRRASRAALVSTLHARRAEGVFGGTMEVVTGLFLTAIAIAAGLSALSGALGLGELITVIGLTQFLIAPLRNFATYAGSVWASAVASAARLLALLREEGGVGAEGGVGDVGDEGGVGESPFVRQEAADHASVPPELGGDGPSVIDSLAPGEIVVVATDGVTADAVLGALRRRHPAVLSAPHAAHLFAGSVFDNVALPGIEASRAHAALVAAGCDELVAMLPRGYDSGVGENGSALSGGQRQRVALARSLAQDAPVLVLHDPTTAVDAVTEAAIAARLREIRGVGRTLIVTRSPALIAVADRVVHVEAAPRPAAASAAVAEAGDTDGATTEPHAPARADAAR
ncbi:ABC transporter transmembrane domain-containing protein [Herbiconiux daphne]|uniref:ABC transporter ATP-binding protein/permease n=1 Tax=Herbiconiux daphne TaxID=2970914 RepID=A0ABT2H1A6_9MICO|nr:ABC transporter ATP-binding protein [Herbiconiux daphne]MCS5733728.1 ABC transporter ATP-binding protein/permease [Herbiconiux daphne]